MPDANPASADAAQAQKMITELKVSGHLMTLDTGLFCIVHTPARALDVDDRPARRAHLACRRRRSGGRRR